MDTLFSSSRERLEVNNLVDYRYAKAVYDSIRAIRECLGYRSPDWDYGLRYKL